MHKIIKAIAHPHYIIELTFDDGATGHVDISSRLYGPMFEPLNDPAFFNKISVDEFGAICWPNNADLSPDTLYTELQLTKKIK
jgi:hypothetical protein